MQNGNILLCALNSQYIHSSPAIYTIKSAYGYYCEKFNISPCNIKTKEMTVNETAEILFRKIMNQKCNIIAFSVYIWNCEIILKLCRMIKLVSPEKIIILGGPEISYGTDKNGFSENDYDYIICGEGERSFFALICSIFNINIPQILSWNFSVKDKKVYCDIIPDLSEIPFPYSGENPNDFNKRITYYESSRGCPFSCAYCLSSIKEKVRFLPVERVKKELKFFVDNSFDQIKFVDRTFNSDKDRATEIWKFIIDNFSDSKTNFHFEIAADLITDEQIDLLKKSPRGLIQFEAGIQSLNEKTLSECCRKTDNKRAVYVLKKLSEQGNINIHTDLIIGLPFETAEIFKSSFNKAFEIKSHQLQLGFLKLLSGTEMNNIAEKHGYIFSPFSPYEILQNKYISFDEINKMKKFELTFEKFFNSLRFILTIEKCLKFFKTPFDFFEQLTDFTEEKNIDLLSVSMIKLYDIFTEFTEKIIHDKDELSEIKKVLLLDYYHSCKSGILPKKLSHLEPMRKFTSQRSREIAEELNIKHNKEYAIKFIEKNYFIFDYSEKNPVTQRYELIQIK